MIRIGNGFDVHKFAEDRKLIIGGVDIPYKLGLAGHSDADVLIHTIMDALLGALCLGDIGKHFPDTDPQYKDISSMKLLHHVWKLIEGQGYSLGNIDSVIICEQPKMAPYIPEMRRIIAEACKTDIDRVNVKATTSEKLGFTGRGEGIASQAVVLLNQKIENIKNCEREE